MAVKTANVTARIQPNIKEQAEEILERLGIPVSVFIDMAYRQVIMRGRRTIFARYSRHSCDKRFINKSGI